MLARLRAMTEADFAALPDSGEAEGLPARLVRAGHAQAHGLGRPGGPPAGPHVIETEYRVIDGDKQG